MGLNCWIQLKWFFEVPQVFCENRRQAKIIEIEEIIKIEEKLKYTTYKVSKKNHRQRKLIKGKKIKSKNK